MPPDRILLDLGAGNASVLIEGDRVTKVRPAIEDALAKRIDCAWAPGVTVQPGEVNAHTHLYSGLVPLGMPPPKKEPENFLHILQRIWWRLDRALDEKSIRASARLYIAEALLAGTTTLIDHHESPNFIEGSLDVLADAAQELGIRLVTAYGATERNGGRDEAIRGLAECRRFAKANTRPLVKPMVGLHASFTVSDDTIREAGALGRELGRPVHIHVAEDKADVEDAMRRGFEGPLQRILALDRAFPAGSILAHGVHLDETMVKRADEGNFWLVQNPRSNKGNRVGYPHALAASRRVAIGTDGYPADMKVEMQALIDSAAENHDSFYADPHVMQERHEGGWRIAADRFRGAFLPPVTPGSNADLIVSAPNAAPRHVFVDGRLVVEDHRLVTANLDAIRAEAGREAKKLWARMEAL